jgi:uncharacterized metal-binding protein YceD (DUF177 family)
MREPKAERQPRSPWNVRVALDDIAETGRHVDLTADRDVRAAIARMAGLRDLPRLEASFDLIRHGANGLHVTGHVSATVGQNCVVTLEPLTNQVEEDVDVLFTPPRPAATKADAAEAFEPAPRRTEGAWNEPEPLIDGAVDLGALAAEFLILGLDPYPRQAGAVFEPLQDARPEPSPFAALAKLTKGRNGD